MCRAVCVDVDGLCMGEGLQDLEMKRTQMKASNHGDVVVRPKLQVKSEELKRRHVIGVGAGCHIPLNAVS